MHGPLLIGMDLRFQVREGPKYKQKKKKIQINIHIGSDDSRDFFRVVIKKLKLCE